MAIGFTIDNSNPFNAIFLPLANKFAENLQNQGVKVFNDTPISNNKNSRIIFGAHSNPTFWLNNKKDNDIFVNCEPIFNKKWQKVNASYMSLLKSSRVLDYSKKSKKYVTNFNLLPMPPFYKSNISDTKVMDVLFVGSINERRKIAFTILQNQGVKIKIGFKIFGNDLFQYIQKSKLFIDINYHDNDAIFNMFRFCLCANTGTIYTGEVGVTSEYPEVEELLGMTITRDIETLPNIITKLLSDKEYWLNALNVQRNIAEKLEAKFQIFFNLFGKEFK